ncbi:TerC family protein [Paenibacillus sp. NPDC058071]|uniref:TerC family protein n=1 Tax=Paenibacillus sp. NPDC058071 TaxID=3346326 RepID=UPI0036DC3419
MESELLTGLLKLILINVLLSGDNAVVIALASRNLPAHQQKKATIWGGAGAVVLRIGLTFVAVWILKIPFVQVVGGLLLLYIAVKLLLDDKGSEGVKSSVTLGGAIKTIIIADLVMSLDNVLAVAGAAQGNVGLIIIGLAISIPLIVWGSQLLMKVMEKLPIIVWAGAALLGYTAGEMMESDKGIGYLFELPFQGGHYVVPILLAGLVVVLGLVLRHRASARHTPQNP